MDVFFGEQVVSIRELLKRYCLHSGYTTGKFADEYAGVTMNLTQPDFPFYKGYCPSGPHDSVDGSFAYSHMTYLNYFAPCYVAYRGGIRWKYLATRNATGQDGVLLEQTRDVFASVTRSDGVTKSLSAYGSYVPYSYDVEKSVFRLYANNN